MEGQDLDSHKSDQNDDRLQLRMEVSHLEHPSLIGTGGAKLREMRKLNSVLIHFPETSQSSPGEENGPCAPSHVHLNEVSIRGKLPNVIAAFQKVRNAIPFQFTFLTTFKNNPDANILESIRGLKHVFKIEVVFKKGSKGETQIVIRGPQESRTLIGVHSVCSLFSAKIQVSQTLCINPHSQSTMWDICNAEERLNSLSSVTGVTIDFPTPRGGSGDKETVTVTGSISGVAAAWIILMSMLPVTIRVFIDQDLDYMKFQPYIQNDLDVHYLVPRRERRPGDRQYIELKSYEGNIGNMCKAYRALMGNNANLQKFRVTSIQQTLNFLGLNFVVVAATEKSQKLPDANSNHAIDVLVATPTPPCPFTSQQEFHPRVHPAPPYLFPYATSRFPHQQQPFPFLSHPGTHFPVVPTCGASKGGYQRVSLQPPQPTGHRCSCLHQSRFSVAPENTPLHFSTNHAVCHSKAKPVQNSQDPLRAHRVVCFSNAEELTNGGRDENTPWCMGPSVLESWSAQFGSGIRRMAEAMYMNPESERDIYPGNLWDNINSILDDGTPSVTDI